MCGISAFYFKEGVPTLNSLCDFLQYGEKRGTDAFGMLSIREGYVFLDRYPYIPKSYNPFCEEFKVGDVFLTNHRAAPETEVASTNDTSVQPLYNDKYKVGLVHNGGVSNFIKKDLLEKGYEFETEIDSECIIHAYIHHGRNMVETMKYLSGGFAFILIDIYRNKLIVVCTHNPLYCGYVRGCGLFFSSMESAIWNMISSIKNIKINKNTMCIWEDYYAHEVPANTIQEIDLDSGMVNSFEIEPRYVSPDWDSYKRYDTGTYATLVAASSGLDSSTTLATLKRANMNPIAVHFLYGHRGQDAECVGIEQVCKILDIPVIYFDISEHMKTIDTYSMLTNKDAKIITGSKDTMKALNAWTCFRNAFFMTYMCAYAESIIVKNNYDYVYISGGWLNLTESGSYPDNSERFVKSFLKMTQFGSLCGKRIKPLYGLCNILKSEQYILLKEMNLLYDLSPWMISCDDPILDNDGLPCNCTVFNPNTKEWEPGCGSGRLSWWASKIAGVSDKRRYYKKELIRTDMLTKETTSKQFDVSTIISKLEIPDENKTTLLKSIKDQS